MARTAWVSRCFVGLIGLGQFLAGELAEGQQVAFLIDDDEVAAGLDVADGVAAIEAGFDDVAPG